ncbi:MAG: DNA polymerase III subunit alpha [Alphaproteobacteria bacterium]|nr:DNA polymerase III subunit alpha [Alphaproteobacteria bacterium]
MTDTNVITLNDFRRERQSKAETRQQQQSSPPPYAEFAVTTNFSFLRGGSHPQEMVLRAADYGLAAIGIADRNSLAGVVRAHSQAKDLDIRLVVGARLVFSDGTPDIIAYPTDRAAYGHLSRLLTLGNRRAEKGDCIINFDDLAELHEGLLFIVVPPRPRSDRVEPALRKLSAIAPGRVWLGASILYRGDDRRHLTRLINASARHNVPLIAIGDVLYHDHARRALQDVLTCIREGVTIDTAGYHLEANAERHLKPPSEMARIFVKIPDAIDETIRFLARIDFSLDELRYQYPEETREGYATPQEALIAYSEAGARWRYPDGIPEKVRNALDHELQLIGELNYAPYFLTVHDLVRYARSHGILCQGRGSAANSVICYCLRITEVDPVKVDLLFERFVSAERREPPDIDVDFEHERREEVMQYIYERYGRHRAGIAATVISYRGRSAVRDVGKAFGLSQDAIGALASTLWGWSDTGPEDKEVRRAGLDPSDPRLKKVLALTGELIDFPRHLSQHVGGFVMTRDRLDEVVPIGNAAMEDRTFVEWDKDDLDTLGILKVDVLALGMLSCIRKAFQMIETHYGRQLTLSNVPWDEPAIYDMLCRADSIGVFQVESRAQMSMLPRLKPREFYDLVIEVAIVRPGPIQGGMVHPYLKRRQGIEKVSFPKDELKEVLHKTLGVPLFQEQAMRIAIVAAGFTPAEADKLRRAMATFRRNGTIHHFEKKFIGGMIERGYEPEFAAACFNQIKGFGDYGFPESHAASFANLVYVSSWIKCHYPDVFAAALLNAQPMGFYAPAQIVRDAQEHGVEMRAVDINASDWDNVLEPYSSSTALAGEGDREAVEGDKPGDDLPTIQHAPSVSPRSLPRASAAPVTRGGDPPPPLKRWRMSEHLHPRHASMADEIRTTCAMRLGFREISGFKQEDAAQLMAKRGQGYDSIRDLWLRTGLDPSTLERLADADAFRSLGLDRREALWVVRGLRRTGDKDDLPLLAFDHAREREPDFALPPMLLGEHVVEDYRHLSLSLKAHPTAFVRDELSARRIIRNGDLTKIPDGQHVTVSGLVLVRQRPGTASGVIFMTLEDETSIANVIVWPKVFERFRPLVLGSRFIAVRGRLQSESSVIHIVAEHMEDLTPLLGMLSADIVSIDTLSRADEVKRPPAVDGRAPMKRPQSRVIPREPPPDEIALYKHPRAQKVMPKGRNFH